MEEKFTMTVTKRQLVIIRKACEDYLRTRMGQFFDLASDIAEAGKKDVQGIEFDEMIGRRNAAQDLMTAAFRIAQPAVQNKTENMLIAEDIYDVVKHELWKMRSAEEQRDTSWCTDAHPPLHFSNEPLVKIERCFDSKE